MVNKVDKWHYIALKSVRTDDGFNRLMRSLSRLIRDLTSDNHGDLLFWIVYIHFEQDSALKN